MNGGMKNSREVGSFGVSGIPFARETDSFVKTESHVPFTAVSTLESSSRPRQVPAENFHPASIDNLVSMCGTINHQLRKYRQLNISLTKKRQIIAKAFHQIPQIEGHGDSLLAFNLDFNSILNNVDETLKRKEGKQNIDGIRRVNDGKSSEKGSGLEVATACKDINGVRRNRITIRCTLGDRVLEELEQKLYETKKAHITLLRNRELEVSNFKKLSCLIDTNNSNLHSSKAKSNDKNVKTQTLREKNKEIDKEFLNSLDDIFDDSLEGSAEMAGELEEAVGIILRDNLLSRTEMMDIVELVDRNWSRQLSENKVGEDNKNSHEFEDIISRKDLELQKKDLSDPLFRSYQLLLNNPTTSKKDDLEILRGQHNNILKKTAELCLPYSPYEFVF